MQDPSRSLNAPKIYDKGYLRDMVVSLIRVDAVRQALEQMAESHDLAPPDDLPLPSFSGIPTSGDGVNPRITIRQHDPAQSRPLRAYA